MDAAMIAVSPANSTALPARRDDTATAIARRYDSHQLFGASNVILIRHAGQDYVLRVTRNGKLILTK